MIKACVVAILLACSTRFAQAQDDSTWQSVLPLETTLESETTDGENAQTVELVSSLLEHPIDINRGSREELMQIPGIDAEVANAILGERARHPIVSREQLLSMPGMTKRLYRSIHKFITMGNEHDGQGLSIALRTRAVRKLEPSRGYLDGAYGGPDYDQLNRLEISSSPTAENPFQQIQAGILTTKDAGEFGLINFLTGYVSVELPFVRAKVLAGDYVFESGQGLVSWRSAGFGKSTELMTSIRKVGQGVRPYRSSSEGMFLRGAALTTEVAGVGISVGYSRAPMSATIDSQGTATSLYTSGLFRTASEQEKRNAFSEELLLARIAFHPWNAVQFGFTGLRSSFDKPLTLSSMGAAPTTSTTVAGIDGQVLLGSFESFAEVGLDRIGNRAFLGGMIVHLSSDLSAAIVARDFPLSFENLHGFAFGRNVGAPRNERGVYITFAANVYRGLFVGGYLDRYVVPNPSVQTPVPTEGTDTKFSLVYSFSAQSELNIHVRNERMLHWHAVPDQFGRAAGELGERFQRTFRVELDQHPARGLSTSSRIELTDLSGDIRERGLLLSQAISARLPFRITATARVMFFRTDSYESRVYAFESDLPGTFSNPAMFGEGIRWSLLATVRMYRGFNCSIKFSQTTMEAVRAIGSGLDQVAGDSQRTLGIQVDINL
ncbi:MAG: helix-hairpin-helix domain-containing protein [Ignavibacteriales bacterium]|nr:helix-hairpin-helix domain-containing protein [Ignavibacteriales bacterium]